jgi:hypothetical protein
LSVGRDSLIRPVNSLFALKKSLFLRVGILACNALKPQGKFGPKNRPKGDFPVKSL